MNKIKSYFYDKNITWPRLIIFSIICGVITGIIPLMKFLDHTSIHNIAECFEMWVLLAMVIILNSKKPLEAGLKTFVFFLISQPLCYLVQVPFYSGGFEIFSYYRYWAILTILTFPGAMLAWYTKKENWFSVIILSAAYFLLAFELENHFITMIKSFPLQLLAVLFILAQVIVFTRIIFSEKKKRIALYIISAIFLVLAVAHNVYTVKANRNTKYSAIKELDGSGYEIVECDEKVDAEIYDDKMFMASSKEKGKYTIKLKDKDGNIIEYIFEANDETINLQSISDN